MSIPNIYFRNPVFNYQRILRLFPMLIIFMSQSLKLVDEKHFAHRPCTAKDQS